MEKLAFQYPKFQPLISSLKCFETWFEVQEDKKWEVEDEEDDELLVNEAMESVKKAVDSPAGNSQVNMKQITVHIFWEGHKIWKNVPILFDIT